MQFHMIQMLHMIAHEMRNIQNIKKILKRFRYSKKLRKKFRQKGINYKFFAHIFKFEEKL